LNTTVLKSSISLSRSASALEPVRTASTEVDRKHYPPAGVLGLFDLSQIRLCDRRTGEKK
jgi:hypothetical protein